MILLILVLQFLVHQIHQKKKTRKGPLTVLDTRVLDKPLKTLFDPTNDFAKAMAGGTVLITHTDQLSREDQHYLGVLLEDRGRDFRFIFAWEKGARDAGGRLDLPTSVRGKMDYGQNFFLLDGLKARGREDKSEIRELLEETLKQCQAAERPQRKERMYFSPAALEILLSHHLPGNLF